MRVYTVHEPPPVAATSDLELIREGFCWPAFLLGALWTLSQGLWLATALILAAFAALGVVAVLLSLDGLTLAALVAAFALIIGFGANDWRRAALARRGWRLVGLSAAPEADAALRRYLDLHPQPSRPQQQPASPASIF